MPVNNSVSGIISIHVPSWGTTYVGQTQNIAIGISIHVPSWGTTAAVSLEIPHYVDFNPRSLVGNDEGQAETCPFVIYFNPRSLVGNDEKEQRQRTYERNFNPRSLVGNDVRLSA